MHRWLRQLPNLISSLRILLVVPIAVSLARHQLVMTLWFFFAAAVSDAVDGYLARRFGWQTELGGMLDPIADKLMLVTVFGVLTYVALVPLWLTLAVLLRDLVIVMGATAYRLSLGRVNADPSLISKLNTVVQMVFILAIIGSEQFALPTHWVVLALGALVFVTVAISGMDYVLVYGRRARNEFRRQRRLASMHGPVS